MQSRVREQFKKQQAERLDGGAVLINLQTHYDMKVALDLLQEPLDTKVHSLSSAA